MTTFLDQQLQLLHSPSPSRSRGPNPLIAARAFALYFKLCRSLKARFLALVFTTDPAGRNFRLTRSLPMTCYENPNL